MRIFTIEGGSVTESATLASLEATQIGAQQVLWIACTRPEFEASQQQLQALLHSLCATQLFDLHISDLLNEQLPSHYDYTSQYDVLVFRRLAAGAGAAGTAQAGTAPEPARLRGGLPILQRIDTSPVGFAVFDQLLLTVHPCDCAVRDAYATKLLNGASTEQRAAGARLPASAADLMLRIVNQMVDGYLELRRELTHQLDHWQTELLDPRTRFTNWSAMLDARVALHQLDEVCEDQRSAIQDWIEALKTWPDPDTPAAHRERELLHVRSRDVLEHIERVVHHVARLEHGAETAVQLHFNAQGSRTNDIMRTLTAVTAVFLPLNLITGFFGMNFEFLPLIHQQAGLWWALGGMVSVAGTLLLVFWRKRYLARTGR